MWQIFHKVGVAKRLRCDGTFSDNFTFTFYVYFSKRKCFTQQTINRVAQTCNQLLGAERQLPALTSNPAKRMPYKFTIKYKIIKKLHCKFTVLNLAVTER